MDDNLHFGDGVVNEAKADINERTRVLVKKLIYGFFDYLEGKVENLPETIKQLRNSTVAETEITEVWSEQLFEAGLIPKGYMGLPDNLLISNFRQEGYLSGLSVGYVLAMMALVDNNVSEDTVLAIRDCLRPNLLGHRYDSRNEFLDRYDDEKYKWIEKSRNPVSDNG